MALGKLPVENTKSIFDGLFTQMAAGKLPTDILLELSESVELSKDPSLAEGYQKAADAYQSLLGKFSGKVLPPEVDAIRWMLEELKVSLFAQQLGTPYPISSKRVLLAVQELK